VTTAAEQLARATRDDQSWIWSVCFEVTDRIHEQLPAFASRPELRDASTASAADVVEHFLSMLAESLPETRLAPGAKARGYARLLVERRISAEDLAGAYRIGVRTFWSRWSALLAERVPADKYADALTESTRYILAWADVLTAQMIAIYNEERSLWNRDPEAVRHETIRAILDGQVPETNRAEQRLRYPLERPHRCLVVWSTDSSVDLRPEHLKDSVPSLFAGNRDPSIVTLPLGVSIAVWWSPADARPLVLPSAVDPSVRAAVGRAADGIAGFRSSYLEAMAARRIAVLEHAPPGSLVDYTSVALRSLASTDLEQASRFVQSTLAALADPDPVVRELAVTLRSFLDHGSNLRATASALRVHHNTVANRIRRAEQLLPGPTVGHTAEILVALDLLTIADHTHGIEPQEVGARVQHSGPAPADALG
jgi:PucR C-terminal helix-turn-helix domain/GGDEF-like domain